MDGLALLRAPSAADTWRKLMSARMRRELACEVREHVPCAPGAYAFVDGNGQLLYVGKSVNLRRRMSSYLRESIGSVELHLGRLVTGIRSFAWWRTRSELLALLLEDALIKECRPPMNTRLREIEENRYLEVTDGPFPSCLVVEHDENFGDREVYGPFRDRYFAERLRDALGRALGIRSCSEHDPSRKCLAYDIGRCTGPCRGAVTPAAYARVVHRVRAFLLGESEDVLEQLEALRDAAASSRRYEDAAALRDAAEMCRRFVDRRRFERRFLSSSCRFDDVADLECAFDRGCLLEPDEVIVEEGVGRTTDASPSGFDPRNAGRQADGFLRRPPGDPRTLLDRTAIVWSWCRRQDVCPTWSQEAASPSCEGRARAA
jgi:excinuclease ABC subunit C